MGLFRDMLEKSGANTKCKVTVDGESVTLPGINRTRDLTGAVELARAEKESWFRVALPKDAIAKDAQTGAVRAVSKDSGEVQGKAIAAGLAALAPRKESKGKGKGTEMPDALADRTQTPEMSGNGVN